MLEKLWLKGIGPAPELTVNWGDGVNVITGDNGLGKSFLLETAWWALTRSWAGAPALPTRGFESSAAIEYTIQAKAGSVTRKIDYDPKRQDWHIGPGRPPIPGFVLYARVDGGFAVMDPARNDDPGENFEPGASRLRRPTAFFFDSKHVWSGLNDGDTVLCNGLIHDWGLWQLQDSDEFAALTKVLGLLSPDPSEKLVPGKPRRLNAIDARDIPTLKMPYGEVPITHASAGVKRILALAYLLVWAWHEHKKASELLGEPPSSRVTLLFDEVEAHLHPRWQRIILPAVLEAVRAIDVPGRGQVVCVTHSPLVLASLEDQWTADSDRLFAFDLESSNESIEPRAYLEELPWVPRGDVNGWLTSDIFDLDEPRSLGGERAISSALELLSQEQPDRGRIKSVVGDLSRHLPDSDPLLARIAYLARDEQAPS